MGLFLDTKTVAFWHSHSQIDAKLVGAGLQQIEKLNKNRNFGSLPGCQNGCTLAVACLYCGGAGLSERFFVRLEEDLPNSGIWRWGVSAPVRLFGGIEAVVLQFQFQRHAKGPGFNYVVFSFCL